LPLAKAAVCYGRQEIDSNPVLNKLIAGSNKPLIFCIGNQLTRLVQLEV
jgi:hypothetical protein